MHNQLQGEKTRLALAVQNCEAAIACVSRPGSPTGNLQVPVHEKEVAVRLRLEDNIDHVCILREYFLARVLFSFDNRLTFRHF